MDQDLPQLPAKLTSRYATEDAQDVSCHEHAPTLHGSGRISDREWDSVATSPLAERWIESFSLRRHYPTLNQVRLLEEAIAESFARWATGRENVFAVDGGPRLSSAESGLDNSDGRGAALRLFQRIASGEAGRAEPDRDLEARRISDSSDEVAAVRFSLGQKELRHLDEL